MDAETSRALFENGAMAVILEVPRGTEFGIDANSWNTGDKFRGVKMIPPGLHLLHYSAVCRSDVGPRTSFFHFFSSRELLVRVWNPATETLEESSDPHLTERLNANRYDLDRFLAPYPYDSVTRWCSLTRHITRSALQRVQPESGRFCSASSLRPDQLSSTAEERSRYCVDADRLPIMTPAPECRVRFSPIPRDSPGSESAAERTLHALDTSRRLTGLLETTGSTAELLAELQLAFVAFLIGHVPDAFDHWKRLVSVICSSDRLLRTESKFFSSFIAVFHYQIQEVPEDFFTDIVSKQNFLVHTLYVFFSNLSDIGVPGELQERGARFQQYLEKKFGWDFGSEPDEYAPVIVDVS